MDSRFFDQHDQPSDVVPVDLDTNTISLGNNFAHLSSRLLPKRAARALKSRLAALQEKSLQHTKSAQRLAMENDDTIDFEFKLRAHENKLELEISNNHTTAVVTHWTGRVVAKASTQEWSIRQFLYNLTDGAALKVL